MEPTWVSECGTVKLWCADCREVLPVIGHVDAVVTDPPYGIYLKGGKWGKKFALEWDREPASGVLEAAVLGRKAIVWGGNYFALPPSRGWLVWWKRDSVQTTADVELAWTSMDMNSRLIDQTIAATNGERCGHPTQKPLRVMKWSLSFVSDCEVVCDPYMGSGTTGVAAVRLGQKFRGVEIDQEYFAIAQRRIQEALNSQPLFKDQEIERQEQLF